MPTSPYQVMAGTVIAGALVTGIKSDLPGDVIATLTEPTHDTATGKFLLIPQGSRILAYNSRVSYGQSRVQVVEPHHPARHLSLTLDNLVGTDPACGSKTTWTGIGIGSLRCVPTTLLGVGGTGRAENRESRSGHRAGRQSQTHRVNQRPEVTRRNLNIQPTLISRPLRRGIIGNRDLGGGHAQPLFFNKGTSMSTTKLRRAAAQDREREA